MLTRAPKAAVVPAPAAALRGAPRMAAWRNPTFWLLGLAVGLVTAGTYGYVTDRWPAPVTVGLHALAIYVGFTVLHESVHRLAHRNRLLNDLVGWVAGIPLTVTQPTFRYVHLAHHAKTNEPDGDPDFLVGRGPLWLRPVSLVCPLWHYRVHYYGRRGWKSRPELAAQVGLDVLVIGVVAGSVLTGRFADLAVLWMLPALLAVSFLAYAFDYLPHRPQDSTERYFDTRVYPSPVLNVVLLGQNYHLVHHAWVTVPWYRYQPVFEAARGDLEAVGARIHKGDWRQPLRAAAAAPVPG
jgi:beta-carotene hydroxylase